MLAALVVSLAADPRVDGSLTGGPAEETTLGGLPEPAGLRVGVATVSLLPPLELRPGAGPEFPRLDHDHFSPDRPRTSQHQMTLSLSK